MINIHKRNIDVFKLLQNSNLCTKIKLFFSTQVAADGYDNYEQNYTQTYLNPLTIKGYVREISAESLVWRQIGAKEVGAKEILCDAKYADWFRNCRKIEIDGDTYETYKETTGGRFMIENRPFNIIKVVVTKK